MDDTLRVGDIVCLYSEDASGFVYSTQTSDVHNDIAVGSRQDRVRPAITDQHIAAFQICVANRYKLNKSYQNRLKMAKEDNENPKDLTAKLKACGGRSMKIVWKRVPLGPVSKRSSCYERCKPKAAAQSETEDNVLDQKRQQGKNVLYGQVIQLRHLFSGKYIHVNTSTTSDLESINLAVCLMTQNAKSAQFWVMPRYKVKDEGDAVQINDQIVLESVKSRGQFLHVSDSLLGSHSIYHNSQELNLSVRRSGFTVYRKYKPLADDKDKLKVGDLIRLYHKEMEAYLVAEGLFDEELTEDVHLRIRPVDPANPNTMNPSSSAVTYWQIELEEGPISGGVVKWKQKCRIIHMCTRRYLNVTAEGQVTLTSDYNDKDTTFRIHSVVSDSDDIPFDTNCRIEHANTGYWLRALTDDYTDVSALKYSKAKLKKIKAVQQMRYDDAFTIQEVKPELKDIFHFMAGMVPFLQKLVKEKEITLYAKSTDVIVKSLKEMKEYLIVDNEPSKDRQKLMRNLRIVDMLVSLLHKKRTQDRKHSYLADIFVATYDVLYTYLSGNSRKNELYIAKHIDFFLMQLHIEGDIGLSAAHMVIKLIRDNRKIVDLITRDHIGKIIDLLNKVKNHRYLELFSVLCVCDGLAISDNQDYITEAWLMGESKNCYLTDLGQKIGKDPGIVYVSADGKRWMKLEEFANEHSKEDNLFLEHQLELFGKLCYGKNESCIDVITNKLNLTWEEAFTCLTHEALQPRLRSKYCRLIITLFVDINNVPCVDRVKLSYIYDDIDSKKDDSGSSNDRIRQLHHWICKFLDGNEAMTAKDTGNNMFIQEVLCLVHFLVSHHRSFDIKILLKHMMNLLNGRNDKPYKEVTDKSALEQYRETDRFKRSPETKVVVDAKLKALEVLDLIFDHVCNQRMEKFMVLFKETRERPELLPLLTCPLELDSNHSVSASKKLKELFEATALLKKDELSDIMLDLSRYEYDEMVRKSMHLLNRYFSAHHDLFRLAVQAQVLITDKSVENVRELESILPSLRRLTTAKLSMEQIEKMCEYLERLTRMCNEGLHSDENYTMNQNILYNCGVLEDCHTILSRDLERQNNRAKKIFQKTFILLKFMVHNNKQIQGRLFDSLDLLLSKEDAPVELANCITEVFTGNFHTCMKISSCQVQKIMELVAKYKKDVPQFLDLLSAIVKVEELDLPLKRNQSYVMTCLRQQQSELTYVAGLSEKEIEDVLVSSDSKAQNYVLSMVDLMTTCAEGENRFIESICQKFFSITFLLNVLNKDALNNSQKRPFLRFLYEVYMCAAGGVIESGAGDLAGDRSVWFFIQCLNEVLKWASDYAQANPVPTKRLLKGTSSKEARNNPEADEMRSTLRYLFDAVLPFLKYFFQDCYQKDSCPSIGIIVSLAENIVTFQQKLAPLIRIKKQMTILQEAGAAIITSSGSNYTMEKFHVKNRACKTIIFEDRKREDEINLMLNVFSLNMRRIYQGVNDVQTQIGFDSKEPYSEVDGDEELPLGTEFQDHLKCFIDVHAKPEDRYRMAEKLVKQLSISATLKNLTEQGKIEQAELDVKCLQLLRGLVHNEIVKLPKDWKLDLSRNKKQLKEIQSVQNALNSYQVIDSTLEQLGRSQDSVVREILAFLAALLFGGNGAVQQSFTDFFLNSKEENFFFVIKIRMQLSATTNREIRSLQVQYMANMTGNVSEEKARVDSVTSGLTQRTFEFQKNRPTEILYFFSSRIPGLVTLRYIVAQHNQPREPG